MSILMFESLYPKFGFVNGEYSERTSVRLGSHQVIDVRIVPEKTYMEAQKYQIITYLQQDDGYSVCERVHYVWLTGHHKSMHFMPIIL